MRCGPAFRKGGRCWASERAFFPLFFLLNPSHLDNVTNYGPNKNQSLTPIRLNYYRTTSTHLSSLIPRFPPHPAPLRTRLRNSEYLIQRERKGTQFSHKRNLTFERGKATGRKFVTSPSLLRETLPPSRRRRVFRFRGRNDPMFRDAPARRRERRSTLCDGSTAAAITDFFFFFVGAEMSDETTIVVEGAGATKITTARKVRIYLAKWRGGSSPRPRYRRPGRKWRTFFVRELIFVDRFSKLRA